MNFKLTINSGINIHNFYILNYAKPCNSLIKTWVNICSTFSNTALLTTQWPHIVTLSLHVVKADRTQGRQSIAFLAWAATRLGQDLQRFLWRHLGENNRINRGTSCKWSGIILITFVPGRQTLTMWSLVNYRDLSRSGVISRHLRPASLGQ